MNKEEQTYWNTFYSLHASETDLVGPSQFAAFVLGEIHSFDTVIEFGCGNGRDAAFFARHGKDVFAFDLSLNGISISQKTYASMPNLRFYARDVTSGLPELAFSTNTVKAIYARFFIHALPTEDISKFFGYCAQLLAPNDRLFLEYRTEEDSDRRKSTSEHFRNFLRIDDVEEMLNTHGMKTSYLAQGIGFAKWKNDDAYVARHIVELTK